MLCSIIHSMVSHIIPQVSKCINIIFKGICCWTLHDSYFDNPDIAVKHPLCMDIIVFGLTIYVQNNLDHLCLSQARAIKTVHWPILTLKRGLCGYELEGQLAWSMYSLPLLLMIECNVLNIDRRMTSRGSLGMVGDQGNSQVHVSSCTHGGHQSHLQ